MIQPTPPDLRPLRDRVELLEPVVLDGVGGLEWRPMTAEDVPAITELFAEAGRLDHPTVVVAEDEVAQLLEMPTVDLALDTIVGVEPGGRIVAYGAVIAGEEHRTVVWITLDGTVHPARRRAGIGTALLAWQEARGRQLLGSSEERLPAWLAAGTEEHVTDAIALFERHGYAPTRWWLELERDLGEPIPQRALPEGVRLEPYLDWREETRLAYNAAFEDHWGSQPATAREWDADERLESARPELSRVLVASDEAGRELVVGFVIVTVSEQEWALRGGSFAYIDALGVRAEWRGRGLASALLADAMRVYRDAGFALAVLDVDAESPTGAVGLYEGLGFRESQRSVSLVKML